MPVHYKPNTICFHPFCADKWQLPANKIIFGVLLTTQKQALFALLLSSPSPFSFSFFLPFTGCVFPRGTHMQK